MNAMLEAALKEFEIALDEIEADLQFVRTAALLRPRLGALVRWDSLDDDSKKMIQEYIGQKSAEVADLYPGVLVLLAGAYEEFVRRVVRATVQIINEATDSYDSLAPSIQFQNTLRTGHALATIAEPLDHIAVDYHGLARAVGTCVPGAKSFTLNAEAFALFVSNLGPKRLSDVLARIGVDLRWDDVGRDQAVRDVLDVVGVREANKAVQERLTRFIQLRNKIAHTGAAGTISLSDSDVSENILFLRALCRRLTQLLAEALAS